MIGQGFYAIVQSFSVDHPGRGVPDRRPAAGARHGHLRGHRLAFTTPRTRLCFPAGQLPRVSVQLRSSLALFDRVVGCLDVAPGIVDAPGAVDRPAIGSGGRVALRGVYLRYPGTPPDALAGVSLEAGPGQLAALAGPGGAGKDHRQLPDPAAVDVTGGPVQIDGADVRHLRRASPAAATGLVTQQSHLFHDTILASIRHRRPAAATAEAEEAARPARIRDRITGFPDGCDTIAGERGYRLPGGGKQRPAIARALPHDPRILIPDEATPAPDTASEREAQKALDALTGARTTIAIAHRPPVIVTADVINVIDAGRVAESGTHRSLPRQDGVHASLYQEQFEGGKVPRQRTGGDIMADGTIRHRQPQPA
jgi:ATP-binding cassette subfamily B protein